MFSGQYLTPSRCDLFYVLEQWPLFRHRCVEGEVGMSEDVSSHLHMDLFYLYEDFSAKMGNANSSPIT